jgi:hypothetical protein
MTVVVMQSTPRAIVRVGNLGCSLFSVEWGHEGTPKAEISAGRQFADTGIDLANQMTPGPVPQPPTAPPFRAPWLYGNQPPELK